MPHNLNQENGQASMMYVGEAPWHKLGTRLDGPATAVDAIRAAGLNWQVIKQPLYAGRESPRLLPGVFRGGARRPLAKGRDQGAGSP